MMKYRHWALVLLAAMPLLTRAVHACGIMVDVYRTYKTERGGMPYGDLAGSFPADEVMFATNTGYNWHPLGLEHFGARIAGTLHVEASGTYEFTLDSDNGSLLFIDGAVVVDNGGVHGPVKVTDKAALDAGRHFFQIQFYNDYVGKSGVDLLLPPGVTYGREPVLPQIPNERVAEHSAYRSSVPVLESGAYPVTWSLVDPPHEAMSIDSQTGVVSWSDPILRTEPYRITVRAANSCGEGQATWLLTVCRAYAATVKANVDEAGAGTPVTFSGQAIRVDNKPATGAQVVIHVTTKGMERILPAVTTDASGLFKTNWQPLAKEAGRYLVWADHPDVASEPAEDELVLFGADIEPNAVDHRIVAGRRIEGSVAIRNLGDVELSALSARVENAPANLTVEPNCPRTLGPRASAALKYSVTASDASAQDAHLDIVVLHKQTPVATLHVHVEVVPVSAILKARPAEITAGMAPGEQTLVDVEVANAGGSKSEALTIHLPTSAAWMSMVTPDIIGPLEPNECATVTLSLMADGTMPAASYDSDLVIGDGQAKVTVPLRLDCMSAAVGSLTVAVADEFTFYGADQRGVAGARVTIVDARTGKLVASADANDGGVAEFKDLDDGYYNVEVTADDHETFHTMVRVSTGNRAQLIAFLSGRLVAYRWTVQSGPLDGRYDFRVEADAAMDAPVPVVTVKPLLLNLCDLANGDTVVRYTFTNDGLIAVRDARLTFQDFAGFEFIPLVDSIDLPARSSVEVPVRIHRDNRSGGISGPCEDCNQCATGTHELSYRLQCGGDNLLYRTPFFGRTCAGACYLPSAGSIVGSGPGINIAGSGLVDQVISSSSGSARARIRIDRRTILAGDPFTATLELDNSGAIPLEKVKLTLAIRDEHGSPGEQVFDIQPPQLAGIDGVDGANSLPAGDSLVARWLCVPTAEAACEEPRRYDISGELAYVANGEQIAATLYPAMIVVQPKAQLEVKYFLERDVYGDDPLTDIIEPAETFSLGMMVANRGSGIAHDVRVVSSQPRVVDDDGRVVNFKITATSIGSDAIAPALNVKLPDIRPQERAVAQWALQSSVRGRFQDYSAGIMHTDALGDRRLAAIGEAAMYDLAHVVRVACPTDDGIPDFLTNSPQSHLPEAIHLSDGSVHPVVSIPHTLSKVAILGNRAYLTIPAASAGYFYTELPDASLAGSSLRAVTRSDGAAIPVGENVWSTRRIVRAAGQAPYEENLLHLFDCGGLGAYVLDYSDLPRLKVDARYFLERRVLGDDPSTTEVEPAIPFSLGLVVRNRGYAAAKDVWLVASPPEIVDRDNHRLPDPNVVGVSVGPNEVSPSLQIRIGDLDVNESKVIRWTMRSALQGRLDRWNVEFVQVDELGRRYPLDVNTVGIHELERVVRASWTAGDDACVFLTHESRNVYDLPDTLYLGDGSVWPEPVTGLLRMVHELVRIRDHVQIRLRVVDVPEGPFYVRYPDPTDGRLTLVAVTRSDGVSIPVGPNAWTTHRTVREPPWEPYEENLLHLFDYGGPGSYTFEYELGDWKSWPQGQP